MTLSVHDVSHSRDQPHNGGQLINDGKSLNLTEECRQIQNYTTQMKFCSVFPTACTVCFCFSTSHYVYYNKKNRQKHSYYHWTENIAFFFLFLLPFYVKDPGLCLPLHHLPLLLRISSLLLLPVLFVPLFFYFTPTSSYLSCSAQPLFSWGLLLGFIRQQQGHYVW